MEEERTQERTRRAEAPTRLIRLGDDHDAFDRAYFAALSFGRKMELVAEMFAEQWLLRGGDEERLRLRRSVARLQRRASYVSRRRSLRRRVARSPRATGDIDVWVEATADNAGRVFRALAAFGTPMNAIGHSTFAEADVVFPIGVPPRRIDVLTGIDGVSFVQAWPNRVASSIGMATTHVLGRDDPLRNKRASGRPRDLAYVERIEHDRRTTRTNVPKRHDRSG